MKTKNISLATLSVLGSLSLLLFSSPAVQAQQPPGSATAPVSFFQSVQSYFSSFDTNSTTFTSERCEIWTGVDQQPDVLSAALGISYVVRSNVMAEAVFRNASVAGTLLSAQAGAGYRIVHYDTEIVAGLDLGYRFDHDQPFAEPYLDVRKALTENTYAGLRLYYQQELSGPDTAAHAPGVLIITGFKF